MAGLADFDVASAKKYAEQKVAAAVEGKEKSFPKMFMPELKDDEVAQFALAFTFNEFGWFLLALIASFRAIWSYGFKTLQEAIKADPAFADNRLAEYLAAVARPNVLEWAGLWNALAAIGQAVQTKGAKAGKSAANTALMASLDSLVAEMLKGLGDAMPAIGESHKKIADLRKRLDSDAPEPLPGTLTRLEEGLHKLEDTLINELAAKPSKRR